MADMVAVAKLGCLGFGSFSYNLDSNTGDG
jgi:hypothetical protein